MRQPFDTAPAATFADDDRAHLDHLLAARKDPTRFEPLYRRYVSDVFYYCFRRLDHREDAADAASRTFANAIARLEAFRPDPVRPAATFRAWLLRIAHNVGVDMQRRQRPQRSLDEEVFRMAHASRTPEESALVRAEAERLREALGCLPERQRHIVELRLADLSGQEIADAMGLSLSAVKSAQFRAFQALRELLRDDDHPRQGSAPQ